MIPKLNKFKVVILKSKEKHKNMTAITLKLTAYTFKFYSILNILALIVKEYANVKKNCFTYIIVF
jgi:hypothetical protein